MNDTGKIDIQIKPEEIFKVLRCKKCRLAYKALLLSKIKAARDAELEGQVDRMVGEVMSPNA